MVALHATPVELAPMLRRVRPEDRMTKERECRDDVMPALREHLTPDEYARAEQWWQNYLGDPEMLQYEMRVTHGDLWWENYLVDDTGSRLLGVLDWEIASVADPARDFAGLAYQGYDFLDAALDAYAALTGSDDPALRYRTRYIFQCREFYGLRHAVQYPHQRELKDALKKIRRVLSEMSP
jgi:aminoglycoside phosphotransferase (APT) family kinase protein